MAKKVNKGDPTPYSTVEEYEKEFTDFWKENTAKAMAELLRHIARETASTIKENKE